VPAPAPAYDRTEPDYCEACHFFPGSAVMPFVVDTWLDSSHANSYHGFNGNTYCAVCHSPFQADPSATQNDNDPVAIENWEAVTCGACHPPHDLRVEWGTPIGNYDVAAQSWIPVYEEDANDLCTHCHAGMQQKDFHSYAKVMYHKKGVRCIDCHMPKIPNDVVAGDTTNRRTHDFKVGLNLPYSCITAECHANKTEQWAAKQIAKNKIHGKTK
jgi:hypothetical protein